MGRMGSVGLAGGIQDGWESFVGDLVVMYHSATNATQWTGKASDMDATDLQEVWCGICQKPFTETSWELRHSGDYGEELHEWCCEESGPCSEGES